MNQVAILVGISLLLVSGCRKGTSQPAKLYKNACEKAFLERPCCSTSCGLAYEEKGNAVPLLIKVLDDSHGETNARIRCSIINGSLWHSELCTNADFQPLIRRGLEDPSKAVRIKTSNMIERAKIKLQPPEPGDTPNPHSPSAQGVGGR